MEEIKKDFLAGRIDGVNSLNPPANKRQSNFVNVQHKDSKQNQSANTFTNQHSKVDLNNQSNIVDDKKRTYSKGRENPPHNITSLSKNIHLNQAVITKL